jgi:hypothetical protein
MSENPATDPEIQSLFGTGKVEIYRSPAATQVHVRGTNSSGAHIGSIITITGECADV